MQAKERFLAILSKECTVFSLGRGKDAECTQTFRDRTLSSNARSGTQVLAVNSGGKGPNLKVAKGRKRRPNLDLATFIKWSSSACDDPSVAIPYLVSKSSGSLRPSSPSVEPQDDRFVPIEQVILPVRRCERSPIGLSWAFIGRDLTQAKGVGRLTTAPQHQADVA